MNLRPYQKVAVQALRAEIAKGGSFTFSMPVGSGRSIVIAEAIRGLGPVVFVYRLRELGEQFRAMCVSLGVTNVRCWNALGRAIEVADLSEYKAVILAEDHRPWPEIDHPRVIQQGWTVDMPFNMAIARLDGIVTSLTVEQQPLSTTTRLEDPQ